MGVAAGESPDCVHLLRLTELLLEGALLGDVAERADATRPSVDVVDLGHAFENQPAAALVLADELIHALVLRLCALFHRRQRFLGDEIAHRAPDHLVQVVTEDLGEAAVRFAHDVVHDNIDPVERRFGDFAIPRLAFFDRCELVLQRVLCEGDASGHRLEGATELAELVGAWHVDRPVVVAFGDGDRRFTQIAQRSGDVATEFPQAKCADRQQHRREYRGVAQEGVGRCQHLVARQLDEQHPGRALDRLLSRIFLAPALAAPDVLADST